MIRKRTKEEQLRGMVATLKKTTPEQTAEVMYEMITRIVDNRSKFNISLICNVILLFLIYNA